MSIHLDGLAAAPFLTAIGFQLPSFVVQIVQAGRWRSSLTATIGNVDSTPLTGQAALTDETRAPAPELPPDLYPAALARRYVHDSDVLLGFACLLSVAASTLLILKPGSIAFVFGLITAFVGPAVVLLLWAIPTGRYEQFTKDHYVSPAIMIVTVIALIGLVFSQTTTTDTNTHAQPTKSEPRTR